MNQKQAETWWHDRAAEKKDAEVVNWLLGRSKVVNEMELLYEDIAWGGWDRTQILNSLQSILCPDPDFKAHETPVDEPQSDLKRTDESQDERHNHDGILGRLSVHEMALEKLIKDFDKHDKWGKGGLSQWLNEQKGAIDKCLMRIEELAYKITVLEKQAGGNDED